jgi:hypothetical protein
MSVVVPLGYHITGVNPVPLQPELWGCHFLLESQRKLNDLLSCPGIWLLLTL